MSSSVTIAGEHSASTVTQLRYNATKDIGTLSGPGVVSRVIRDVLKAGVWPADPDAVYVLFTGPNIMQVRHIALAWRWLQDSLHCMH